jgi:hypothetical protein
MASKNLQYKVNGAPTKEDIEKFDNDEHIFYRFQNPYIRLTSRSKSWGMIYDSEREARKAYKDDDLNPDDAILNGKSCMPTFEEIISYSQYYSNDDVLLVFNGTDTFETGHDGEYVATYEGKVAVWSMVDVNEYANKLYEESQEEIA